MKVDFADPFLLKQDIVDIKVLSNISLGVYEIAPKFSCENGWTQGFKYYIFIQKRRQDFQPLFGLELF